MSAPGRLRRVRINGTDVRVGHRPGKPLVSVALTLPGEKAFRCHCPWCHASIVVMSELAPSKPRPEPPAVGDAIKCDACDQFCVVGGHGLEGKLSVFKVELPNQGGDEN